MFISELVLHRCRRFYLKGIETLKIDPSLKTQIILGTNGSGKSSLLKIGFTVLPADARDFLKGGYKYIKVLHNGRVYELKNSFEGKSPTHSFIVDGEELNEGMTGAVQRELVREHFGMTQELHQVLSGQLKFTEMNAIQRREWITLLSSADFEYVIKLHGRIKRAVRDTNAVIKHLSGRLVNESAKKVDEATFNSLRRQSQEVYDKLMSLHQHSKREGLPDTFDYYNREYHSLSAEIESLLHHASALKSEVPVIVKDTDNDAVIALKDSLRTRVQMLEAALHEVSDRHQEIDKQLHDLSELEDVDPVMLEEQIMAYTDHLLELKGKFRTSSDSTKLPNHEYCFATIRETMDLLHDVVIADASYLDRNVHVEKQRELSELQNNMMKGQSRIGELEYRLDHIRNCASVQCPNCNHSFKEGVSGNEESEIRQLLEKGYSFRRNTEEKIASITSWMREAHAIGEVMYTLQNLRDHNPDLSQLWYLITTNGGFEAGRALIPLCNDFIGDVKNNLAIIEAERELKPLLERRQQLQQADGSTHLREVAHSLSERVVDLKGHLIDARETLKEVEAFHVKMTESRQISQAVEMGMARLNELMDSMVKFVAVEEIEAQVKRHQVQLGMLEQSLAEAEVQMGIVNDLNRSLEEARDEEEALIELEKLLSPKDGIIAEQILVFINTFIGAINDVIAKVWGYNLALDTCNLEEGELDYKFPMYIHNTDNMIDDIRFGSDSQIDIVNQAFVLVVYQFLELQGYPLYLDELGRTFDEVHRLNLTLALKDLMDDETYSQVFFISHSFESQNSYPNSQLVVIDDSHVSLKRTYNEHVEIL
ncbi:putative SbcC ATPase [Pseudomonas phage pPa_SNUABM_DT01]|nr:putative SbcC ATPase [Pseudomonas phage pPa_SNUABM_DT01]